MSNQVIPFKLRCNETSNWTNNVFDEDKDRDFDWNPEAEKR